MKCPNCKGKGYRLSTSWVPHKSTTTVDCGRCNGTGECDPPELRAEHQPGQIVTVSLLGSKFQGTLKTWDNGTAIVVTADGQEKAVRGR